MLYIQVKVWWNCFLDCRLIHSFEVAGKMKGHCNLLSNIFNSTLGKKIGKSDEITKGKWLQLNRTQFPSLGFFVCKKVGNRKN